MVTIPVDTLVEAWNLAGRLQKGTRFRAYVERRLGLVLACLAVLALFVVAATSATAVFLSGTGAAFVLPAFLLAPFLLAGGLAVSTFLFLSWLEARALSRTLRHPPRGGLLPRVPWVLAAVFLVVPGLILVASWWRVGVPLACLAACVPFAFARLDRSAAR